MKNTFNVGDRVGVGSDDTGFIKNITYGKEGNGVVFGVIKEVVSNTKVKILFDDGWLNDRVTHRTRGSSEKTEIVPVEIQTSFLLSEADAKRKYSELEKEFEVVMKQIEAKLEKAGKLVREANEIAKDNGYGPLADIYEAASLLTDAMDDCGWRSSSFNC